MKLARESFSLQHGLPLQKFRCLKGFIGCRLFPWDYFRAQTRLGASMNQSMENSSTPWRAELSKLPRCRKDRLLYRTTHLRALR